ncbi:Glycosyl hydrolases family 2, TIM barrel domain [Chitinophaga sp. YR573]|uniref:glycosyl hydrolase 2 galactose-binding domain-containing protein n=1 Tax=Chitinophaga sp. YR573 TaxID=1881040 RepID=UPI0008C65626|nr:sugar-binding domain-containing protein [Chitinophaga sp. YR573]SEW38969.1 Glycosyl hydrolases family 2, TIM barrel domain [Chitinophaga sp. YR573]
MKSIALLLLFHVTGSSLYSQQLHWRISPVIQSQPSAIATAGFADKNWIPAIVPGTVFYAYVRAGKEKDPDYGDNIYHVDKEKYNQPFWYRTEFPAMTVKNNQRVWLKFNGINKYADIWFNGKQIGYLHGHIQRGIYDITNLLNTKGANAIAVLVSPPKFDHGLANWESPTYICSGSWDWMPAVPGLNSGITDTVALTVTGPVSITDPWIRADMPDTNAATIRVSAQVMNSSPVAVTGKLKAVISPGNIIISSSEVTLAAGSSQEINLQPQYMQHPHLWWPNGYGQQFLYDCKLSFETATISQSFGIRKISADTTSLNGPMRVYINQVPVLLKGGNWGMSDYMLKVRGKDYETRIRLHQAMNFNMIRNWTGEITDNAFYEYCDQYGIMVWDDFWLNNMGGIDSLHMFEDNVIEKLKKFRNHPSIVIWCGANEGVPGGNPDGDLSNVITNAIHTYDGDYRLYLPRSNAGVANPNFSIHGGSKNLSGSGIWANIDPKSYFTDPHNGYLFSTNSWGMRSELGMATFVNPESFKKFMPQNYWVAPTPDSVNSKDNMWARHFFSTDGAMGGGADPVKYINDINKSYGQAVSLEDFCKKAQLLNLETMKAMFEAWNDHMWNDASGILIWMSQSAYPSMIWQTYDYYYDLTGAYFGAKSACEPMHIQWNPASKMVKVINNKNCSFHNLTASATVYNADGRAVRQYAKKTNLVVNASSVKDAFIMLTDTAGLYFLRLNLYADNGQLLSENTYWVGNYTSLNALPAVRISISAPLKTSEGVTYTVSNQSKQSAAVGIRVQLLDNNGKQILPVLINDSYFTLMQGEKKQVQIEVSSAQLKNGYKLDAKAYNE